MMTSTASIVTLAAAETERFSRDFMFAEPAWLWALVLIPLLVLLRRRMGTAAAIQHPGLRVIAEHLPKPATLAGFIGPVTTLSAVACIIAALAQPQWKETHKEPIASGIDIMIACDLSGSMAEKDMRLKGRIVDRLTSAQHVINEFINNRPNDRMGLVAFAGKAKLCSPLTMDHDILRHKIDSFYLADVNPFGQLIRPGYIIEDGTAIGSAIASAASRLHDRKETKSKILILVTDGINNRGEIGPLEAAQSAAELGIRIYTIAIGSDKRLSGRLVQHDTIDEKSLKEIAELTGGRYYRAGSSQSLADAFAVIDKLEKTDSAPRTFVVYDKLFYWPMGAAALLLLIALGANMVLPKPAP
ncbi:MAG: VWA domain-containing protein [Akkermansia sp.]|nr:VWA domain-containing protein [Akkermansia sp.]